MIPFWYYALFRAYVSKASKKMSIQQAVSNEFQKQRALNEPVYRQGMKRHPLISGFLRMLIEPYFTINDLYNVRDEYAKEERPKPTLSACFDALNAQVKKVHNFRDDEYHLANYVADMAYFIERLDLNRDTEILDLILPDTLLSSVSPDRRNLSLATTGMFERAYRLTGIPLN